MRESEESQGLVTILAAGALAVAGLFGAASLYPLVTGAREWFYSFITAHISLGIHLWIPAAEIVVWRYSARLLEVRVKPVAGTLAGLIIGGSLMALGLVEGWSRPLPIDYAPMFKSPLFAAGMIVVYTVWLAASLTPLRAWLAFVREHRPERKKAPVALAGFLAASVAAWATAVNILAACVTTPKDVSATYAFQTIAYGPGHSIQFAHVSMMAATWIMMSGFEDRGWRRTALRSLFTLAGGFVALTPLLYVFEDPVAQTMGMAWTLSLGMVLGTVTLLMGAVILSGMNRSSRSAALVVVSMLCFLVGGAAPSLDDRESLALTAHYHGLLMGVSSSYIGLIMGTRAGSMRPAVLFGTGGLLMALSFLWLTQTRLLRKTVALEGLWPESQTACVILLTGATLAGVAVLWQTLDLIRNKKPPEPPE